ncbi:aminotransferase class I/II-fold pyridoxal phosphate-dependent enzyme [Halorarum salinum]|uniref:Aminotransferase n=1 Tax=Halorarum salinum TaxID=2743089 RepID=A0A7D5LE36_9EURY|nr:aminotransferase class I/II-fold pyridoxal phosphate-dependent enzyme [Halobaculum salinum]QLG63829.1 pyridoxal phosphate-dependent class II aminotransferase [Halobaculum salinum]
MHPDALGSVGRVPHGGESDPAVLDFSANTNPERPPGVADVYAEALEGSRRYPDDDYPEFRAAAAEYVGCDPGHVIASPGGLAGMRLAFEATLTAGDSALVPYPSFSEYAREVRLQGADPEFVPHDAILGADPSGHALAVVCTPNNPTGEAADPEALRRFARRCRESETDLLVDEAFLDYTGLASLAGEPGAVVARSLTKVFGLPGLRAGFLVAEGDLRARLAAARPPWNLSTPAARVGARCLRATDFVGETRERTDRERERLRTRLEPAYDVAPSDAPFLLLDTRERDPEQVVARARDRGVAVRDATTFRGLRNHVRVAVKRREGNDELLRALPGVGP